MPLIQNYGLFWHVDDVYWGNPGAGNKRHLSGFRAGDATRKVDFGEQVAIYVLYADYRIVYIGQTGVGNDRLISRLVHHRRHDLANRWNQFSWFGFRRVSTNAGGHDLLQMPKKIADDYPKMMDHLEAVLIYAAEPPLNRQGGKFGAKVDQYLQYRDIDRLGPTQQDMIKAIWQLTTKRQES